MSGELWICCSAQEINNGRMAMFAIMGQIAAELETGKGPVDQFLG